MTVQSKGMATGQRQMMTENPVDGESRFVAVYLHAPIAATIH